MADLPSDFRINQLLDLMDDDWKDITVEKETFDSTSLDVLYCSQHTRKKLDFYCETCEEAICSQCFKQRGAHFSHIWEDLNDAFVKQKGKILSSLDTTQKMLAQLDTQCNEISDQQVNIEADIHKAVAQLQQNLDVRKTELINLLHQLTQDKLKCLAAQKDQIETIQVQLNSYLYSLEEASKTKREEPSLHSKITNVIQAQELTSRVQQDTSELKTEADIIFSTLTDLTVECQKYGQISAGPPDPGKCYASDVRLEMATVGKESSGLLQILNADDQPCMISIESITCELVSELTGTTTKGKIERKVQNQYQISYQPTIKGRHRLHIKVKGQHINGSPFVVTAKSLGENISTTPILTFGGINKPMGIALNKNGEMVVTEGDEHCFSVLSPSGDKLRFFGTNGTSDGEFDYPHGVTVDGKENIIIADFYNHRFQIFDMQGKFLSKIGKRGSGPLKFSLVHNVALNPSNGKVYVADIDGRIQILNSDFTYSGSFGGKGSGESQFNSPQYIAFDGPGNVYVVDRYNNRIQVFTADGKFLRMFGQCGETALKEPVGIAIDSSNRLFVSEWGNHRISVFTLEGEFVMSFGSEGKEPGQFNGPRGLAVDSSGVLYVCDGSNNRIQLF